MGDFRELDVWARWLLSERCGGNAEALEHQVAALIPFRDKVLDNARLKNGDVVLDAGCGDGLIGFGALLRPDINVRVVFSDISQPLLERCREAASELGLSDRCSFSLTPIETLAGVDSQSVDVVTTRSVLIYVDDKAKAFEACFRVL